TPFRRYRCASDTDAFRQRPEYLCLCRNYHAGRDSKEKCNYDDRFCTPIPKRRRQERPGRHLRRRTGQVPPHNDDDHGSADGDFAYRSWRRLRRGSPAPTRARSCRRIGFLAVVDALHHSGSLYLSGRISTQDLYMEKEQQSDGGRIWKRLRQEIIKRAPARKRSHWLSLLLSVCLALWCFISILA